MNINEECLLCLAELAAVLKLVMRLIASARDSSPRSLKLVSNYLFCLKTELHEVFVI